MTNLKTKQKKAKEGIYRVVATLGKEDGLGLEEWLNTWSESGYRLVQIVNKRAIFERIQV